MTIVAKIKDRVSIPDPLVYCFFGFSFARAANESLAYQIANNGTFDPIVAGDAYTAVQLVAFLLGIAFAGRLAPLFRRRQAFRLALLTAVTAALANYLVAYPGSASAALFAILVLSSGASGALLILLWAELHSCLDSFRIMFYISCSFLLGMLLAWVAQGLEGERLLFALLAFPSMSIACLVKSFGHISPINLPHPISAPRSFPWRLIVVLGVYEFAYGVREASGSMPEATYYLGGVLAPLGVLAYICLAAKRTNMPFFHRSPFALMLCGLALAPVQSLAGEFASGLLVSIGYSLMFLLLTFLMCDLARRHAVSVLVLCGIQEFTAFFRLAGHQALPFLSSDALSLYPPETTINAALTVAIVAASFLLFQGGAGRGNWAESFFGICEAREDDYDALQFSQRCSELAASHGLSPREQEVFELLAQGKSSAFIERTLVIANGTLKSHTRRIYKKLGINSKKELLALVKQERA